MTNPKQFSFLLRFTLACVVLGLSSPTATATAINWGDSSAPLVTISQGNASIQQNGIDSRNTDGINLFGNLDFNTGGGGLVTISITTLRAFTVSSNQTGSLIAQETGSFWSNLNSSNNSILRVFTVQSSVIEFPAIAVTATPTTVTLPQRLPYNQDPNNDGAPDGSLRASGFKLGDQTLSFAPGQTYHLSQTVNLTFTAISPNEVVRENFGLLYSNIIPEPSSIILVTAGALALLGYRYWHQGRKRV